MQIGDCDEKEDEAGKAAEEREIREYQPNGYHRFALAHQVPRKEGLIRPFVMLTRNTI